MSRATERPGRVHVSSNRVAPTGLVAGLQAYRAVSSRSRFFDSANGALKLDWNEATTPPSPRVFEALSAFLATGRLNWYPDPEANELRRRLSKYTGRPPSGIQVFNGSDSALDYLVRTFVGAGDHVVICSPCYDNFRVSAESAGAEVERVYSRSPFAASVRDLAGRLRPSTRLVYISNPNNPTGRMYSLADLEAILTRLPNGILVVDEAYYEFAGRTAAPLLDRYEPLVVARSFSKAFGLAGIRCGYLLASPRVLRHVNKIRNGKDVNALAQVAAAAALEDLAHMRAYVAEVRRGRAWLARALRSLGHQVVTSPANFVLLRAADPACLIDHLQSKGIYVRDRSYLPQLESYVRITVGTLEQCRRVVGALNGIAPARLVPRDR
jgi:histidinol-phosphate aminotransferase